MTVSLNIRADVRDVTRDLNRVQRHIVPRATNSALNKTVRQIRTRAVRELAGEIRVKQKLIRDRVTISRSRPRRLTARIFAIVADLPAILLNPRDTRAGVSARGHQFPGAFIARMPSGHRGVFKRRSRRRLPIEEQKIPIGERGVQIFNKWVFRLGPSTFKKLLERELAFRLNR